MSIQLIHFLGTVVTAEYEKLEQQKDSESTVSTSDSETSQTNTAILTVPCLEQDTITTTYKRPKYSDDQQRKVIEIYDSFPCKLTAMKVINQMHGYESIYKRKIERWKRSDKPMGRPVSREFEDEVIKEYIEYRKRICINSCITSGANPIMTNASLKKCALAVFDRDYWDEKSNSYIKKWQIDKRTCNLCFSNRWITGMLMRRKKSIAEGSVHIDNRSTSANCSKLLSCNSDVNTEEG